MKLITLEEHWDSKQVDEAAKAYRPKPLQAHKDPNDHSIQEYLQQASSNPTDFSPANEDRFNFMKQNGITKQILGYGDNTVQNLDPKVSVDLAKMANDELATAIKAHPDQLGGWATLPVGDPQSAADELDRAVTKLGMNGAIITGRYNDHFFDERIYDPLFAKAEALGVPLYFHPALVQEPVRSHYYTNGDWSELAGYLFAGPGWGWHSDLGIQMVRLIMAGVFERFPKLHIITGHWGEMVPNFLDRLDEVMCDPPFMKNALPLTRSIAETYKENFWITPSGQFTWPQLQLDLTEMGPDHIMYSLDYPYNQPAGAQDLLANSPIDDDVKEKIAHGNAEKLLHL